MTPEDFDYLRKMLRERSGLVLSVDKQYLAESRLLPLARRHGFASVGELVAQLKMPSCTLATEVVDAMTTNETFFFRDKIPFELLRDSVMPALLAARSHTKRVRIWCTAASTGQEPYSIAMTLREMGARLAGFQVDILATDLVVGALDRARNGLYTQFEVQRGLPIQLLIKYFTKVGEMWQIAPELRAMVQFRPLNLLYDFSTLGLFDLVFCRNVLIYFDQSTKVSVLDRIARQMPDDGFLILGAAETVVGLTEAFTPHPDKRGLYRPSNAGAPARLGAPKLAVRA
ncbi:MAG: protein-glutamate O-methyltransferase CheR [Pseudolabrys sp.]|nr:protein-glutamate O-methyltransferase CheR [Pseudolabrys sp.]